METLNNSHGILLDFSHLSRRGVNRNHPQLNDFLEKSGRLSRRGGNGNEPEERLTDRAYCHLSRRGVNRNSCVSASSALRMQSPLTQRWEWKLILTYFVIVCRNLSPLAQRCE